MDPSTRAVRPAFAAPVSLIRLVLFVAIAALGMPRVVAADGLGQRPPSAGGEEPERVEEMVVVGSRSAPTAPSLDEARRRMDRIPGAVGVVDDATFEDLYVQSLGDALIFTPGVFADTSAQRESRISIRGSGLNSSFERRGITVLRDGVPISRASGLTEFQEVDPISIDYIEIYKGANSLRYGGSSLGGVINIVSPTGRTQPEGITLRAEGGSFATTRAHASVALAKETVDFYAGVTGLRSDGFRQHSDVESVYGHANLGIRLGGLGETRFYATALSDNFELAGTLALDDALDNPEDAGRPVTIGPFFPGGPVTVLDPGPVADDWDRNLDVYRLSNATVLRFDRVTVETGAWFAYRDLDHAITRFAGIIDQEEWEAGGQLRLEGHFRLAERAVDWVAGASAAFSRNDAQIFENDFGGRGALTQRSDQKARNLLAYAQADIEIVESWTAILGLQYLNTERENEAEFQDTSGQVSESQINPRFGLLWDAAEEVQVFTNVSRSFEPATMADLTSGGALDFTPLRAQDAWTVEVGSRGQRSLVVPDIVPDGALAVAWDVAWFRSWIEDEFVDLPVAGSNGFLSNTFNASRTIHQGVELGLTIYVEPAPLEAIGLKLTLRNVYTYSDFFFDDDPDDLVGIASVSGNQLPAIPEHVYVFDARLDYEDRASLSFNVRYVPDGPFADFANTTRIPSYTLLGLSASVNVVESLRFFFSAENLTDDVYISNLTTVGDQSLENARVFTPGQGRAFFGGFEWRY
jgi:iron complex outermembrane receptor protein